jgi:hypothetical protein
MRDAGGDRFEEPAHLGQLQLGVAAQQFDGRAEPFEQDRWLQAGHVG